VAEAGLIEGVINLLKPPGMTSSNAVTDVRRLFGIKRVGHTGTLDPGAAGVLPICLGRATRLFDLLVDKEKEYIAELRFGTCTDTQDSYGTVIATSDAAVSEQELLRILPEFLGEQQQLPPMYSALKQDGKSLYQLARSGKMVEREARKIVIHSLELVDRTAQDRFLLKVRCSRGTYVRTLCEDIAARLGKCAHMSFLLRTAAGPFRVEEAYSIAELTEHKEQGTLHRLLVPVDQTLSFLPELRLPEGTEFERQLLNGIPVPVTALTQTPFGEGQQLRLYGEHFLGVAVQQEEQLRMKLHFV